MTEITTIPTERPQAVPFHPADILLNLIVALLAPMFLTDSGGDINFARMAARETVNAYRVRNHADLIAVAQIIACGLAALGSLSLSMADDLSLAMTLRLRGNANALIRSAERNRRVIGASRPDDPAEADFGPDPFEAEVMASLAETQQRFDETRARQPEAEPPAERPAGQPSIPVGHPPASTQAGQQMAEQQMSEIWAASMTKVAGEFAASLPHLRPAERKVASLRAAALNSCANELLSGSLPPRLRPGALNALNHPNEPRPGYGAGPYSPAR